jgi:uncharacterized membrane protein YphA (DoxX/SURF4 family)
MEGSMNTLQVTAPTPWTGRRIGFLALRVVLALAFIAAALFKLQGPPPIVEEFEKLGLGQWFRYLTSVVEISGAVLLFVPRFTVVGGFLLAATMFFAVLGHVFVFGGNPAPALLLLVLSTAVLWIRRGDIAGLQQQFLR